jgi:hypothetical protein
MRAACHDADQRGTSLGRSAADTTSAGSALEAGARKARATPKASTNPKIGTTDVGPVAA